MPCNPTRSKDVRHVKRNMDKKLNIMGTYAVDFDRVKSISASFERVT